MLGKRGVVQLLAAGVSSTAVLVFANQRSIDRGLPSPPTATHASQRTAPTPGIFAAAVPNLPAVCRAECESEARQYARKFARFAAKSRDLGIAGEQTVCVQTGSSTQDRPSKLRQSLDCCGNRVHATLDRKSTRLNSSH